MLNDEHLPRIFPLFDAAGEHYSNHHFYRDAIRNSLKQILPASFATLKKNDPDHFEDFRTEFFDSLPIFFATKCDRAPGNISFYVLAKYRTNAFKFFFDMVSHWLVPGKRLNAMLFYAVDFMLPDFGNEALTLCEAMVHVESIAELETLQRNLPIIETEIRLGMQSSHNARRILEIKGLSLDSKTAMIQEHITWLTARRPKYFDQDLVTEMQHVLVMCRDEFKMARSCSHLGRIISAHYLFRKSIREAVKQTPEKRHLSLKLFKTHLNEEDGNKPVLGVLVGINFLKDKEVFEERHLLNAIQNYIPTAKAVEQSFFSHRRGNENICTLYLEIEKSTEEPFTGEDIRLLRRELPADLKDRIEHLMHPIFMPRNEEEIMRHVLTLSNQIKYMHDLPQAILSFDKQTHTDLCFTVIMVRPVTPGSASIEEMFRATNTFLGYTHDRSRTLGFLRKKCAKEATVFGVKVPKDPFLRRDHSIDLNKARQAVVNELTRITGEFRDFNGGMISKQHELLCAVRELLNHTKYNELLLENFFYSLTPDVMRTVLEPQVLKTLFMLLLESIEDNFFSGENYSIKIRQDTRHVYALIKTEDRTLKETIGRSMHSIPTHSYQLATSSVLVYDTGYLGFLYLCDDPGRQQQFCHIIQESVLSKQPAQAQIQIK